MFMLKSGGVVWDPDLDMLADVLVVLDRHLASILGEWQTAAECDQCGIVWTEPNILPA